MHHISSFNLVICKRKFISVVFLKQTRKERGKLKTNINRIGWLVSIRFVMITFHDHYARIYTKTTVALMVGFTWIFSFSLLLPTLVGKFGENIYQPPLSAMCWSWRTLESNSNLVIVNNVKAQVDTRYSFWVESSRQAAWAFLIPVTRVEFDPKFKLCRMGTSSFNCSEYVVEVGRHQLCRSAALRSVSWIISKAIKMNK